MYVVSPLFITHIPLHNFLLQVTLMDVFEFFEETPTPVTREVIIVLYLLKTFGQFFSAAVLFHCVFSQHILICTAQRVVHFFTFRCS